jgi:hypothetical protein
VAHKKVTRVIVYEGHADWVDETLITSLLHMGKREVFNAARGSISLISQEEKILPEVPDGT